MLFSFWVHCINHLWILFQIQDIQFFFMILAVFVLSFGVTYQANLFPNAPRSWSLLKNIVYLPYWQMYGELFLENIEGKIIYPILYLRGCHVFFFFQLWKNDNRDMNFWKNYIWNYDRNIKRQKYTVLKCCY